MSDFPQGRFCWYDLMTTNIDAAREFYTNLIGWGTDTFDGPEGMPPYLMWTNGEGDDKTIGGVMLLSEEAKQMGAPPNWMAYIATSDLAATVAKATEGGAKILVPATPIPTVGQFSIIQDPQGAVFAAFQPEGDAPGSDELSGLGGIGWHELATSDHEAAFSFYQGLFGWKKGDAMDMGPMGTYQLYNNGAHSLGGIFDKSDDMPMNAWLYYLEVADVDASAAKVTELGGQVVSGPMDVPGGDRVVQCVDPQGAFFALHSPAPA